MSWCDWLILFFPICFVLMIAWYTRRYAKDVTNFISSGRTCGRYVIAVGDVAEGLSIMGLVSYVEIHYRNGFATSFWTALFLPLSVILSLFGYCNYRMRETKAQSLGEFVELRYSRKLRVFAAFLRCTSEMFTNMIMPALAARFFIYFLDLPQHFTVGGVEVSTFHLLMLVVLTLAIFIIWVGGSISINITDTIQGFFCYPMLVVMVIYILYKYPWGEQILPVLMDKIPGESMINPTDIERLRDFNLFSVLALPFITRFLQRVSWFGGGGSSTAARSAHEQKMAGLLGTWRGSLGSMFYILVALALLTVLNHHFHADKAHDIRVELTEKVAREVIEDPKMRESVAQKMKKLPKVVHVVGVDAKRADKNNTDTKYLDAGRKALLAQDKEHGNAIYSEFRTLYYQLMLPVTLRNILPIGMMGLFCVLVVMLMISTDDSRIFSSAVCISQDIILPFLKKPLTPKQHMMLLRMMSLFVGVFFFIGSSFMAQLDYISLFGTMMCTLWCGGCGPVLVLGLYSRFGTTAGAWSSLLTSLAMGGFGIFCQRNWSDLVYPFLEKHGMVESVGNVLSALSQPFNPYIVWEMNPVRCPVNSYELYFFTQITTLLVYIAVSYATCKEPFNLERMLHRGKYSLGEVREIKSAWTWKNLYNKLVGITPEYTTGDKFIAWGYVGYTFVYRFGLTFVVTAIWNAISPWPIEYWAMYFLVVFLVIPGIMAAITAVWFGIGGVIDLRRMFYDLEHREANYLDNGMVVNNMSLADKAAFEKMDEKKAESSGKQG
ncbi:MAG: sodium:panthothenate symporter [Lentisphaerae bacterium]|nr:sodium:panthothenate symporter [Lentisphaerota bacterium]